MEKNIPGPEEDARGRLERLARENGSSLAALSRLLGRNPAYLQQYVTRQSPRHLDEPDVDRIAAFLGISPQLIRTRPAGAGDHGEAQDHRAIPRLALEASAGPGAVGSTEMPYDTIRFSRRWLREMGLDGADLSAIRVEGDSMQPVLNSGDEIFVDRNKRRGEGIFVVRIGDALHVKQIGASAADRIVLVSANPAYPPLDLPRAEVEIVGRVVWKGGRI